MTAGRDGAGARMTGRNLRQDLVALRNLRENRTVRALGRLHRECTEANVHLQREQRQLDVWRCQASDEETALYADLMAEPVNRHGWSAPSPGSTGCASTCAHWNRPWNRHGKKRDRSAVRRWTRKE